MRGKLDWVEGEGRSGCNGLMPDATVFREMVDNLELVDLHLVGGNGLG